MSFNKFVGIRQGQSILVHLSIKSKGYLLKTSNPIWKLQVRELGIVR